MYKACQNNPFRGRQQWCSQRVCSVGPGVPDFHKNFFFFFRINGTGIECWNPYLAYQLGWPTREKCLATSLGAKPSLSLISVNGPQPGVHSIIELAVSDEPVSFVIPVAGQQGLFAIGLGTTLAGLRWNLNENPKKVVGLATVDHGKVGNRWNDAKADINGYLWAGKCAYKYVVNTTDNFWASTRVISVRPNDLWISKKIKINSRNHIMAIDNRIIIIITILVIINYYSYYYSIIYDHGIIL